MKVRWRERLETTKNARALNLHPSLSRLLRLHPPSFSLTPPPVASPGWKARVPPPPTHKTLLLIQSVCVTRGRDGVFRKLPPSAREEGAAAISKSTGA
jgi:hypothetical protein